MLTNNDIYKKIKVALSLQDQDTLAIFYLVGIEKTRSFCKAINSSIDNRHFRPLSDADLDAFLDGLIIYKRELSR
jgi:uncharacterized protein YehS (DUF1456 family)